jgi:T-complex protein 1 subunit delta
MSKNRGITGHFKSNEEKGEDVRISNIKNAKALADAIRTSLGPRGMDKMIQSGQTGGNVIITNDGATILKQMDVGHPTAKMLVDLSKSQDIECGDGTTSVVVMAGALLQASLNLLEKGIHPTVISEGFNNALEYAMKVLDEMAIPVDLNDREMLLNATITSLSSKVVSYNSDKLAPIAVDTVLSILPLQITENVVDLRDIKIVKKMGGTLDESGIYDGVVFTSPKTNINKGGPSKVANPKIGLIQFCMTAPKTDLDNNIVVND